MVEQWICNPPIRVRFSRKAPEALTSDKLRIIIYLMPYSFYTDEKYRKKQSELTKLSWKKGVFDFKIKPPERRVCKNKDCGKYFSAKSYDKKKFCSKSCAAHSNQLGRIMPLAQRQKISKAHLLIPHRKFPERIIRIDVSCVSCDKKFKVAPYIAKTRKYCGKLCASRALGRLTTSPKASKGKNGIRKDIDSVINFYSTWEANVARVYNLINIKWEYAPKRFDLGEHTYRPDFYLIDYKIFVEVKNFMSDYSLKRDTLFRQKFPNIPLDLIMKEEYTEITKNYKNLVDNWES